MTGIETDLAVRAMARRSIAELARIEAPPPGQRQLQWREGHELPGAARIRLNRPFGHVPVDQEQAEHEHLVQFVRSSWPLRHRYPRVARAHAARLRLFRNEMRARLGSAVACLCAVLARGDLP